MVEGAEDEFFLSLEEDEPAAKVVKSKPTPQKKKKTKEKRSKNGRRPPNSYSRTCRHLSGRTSDGDLRAGVAICSEWIAQTAPARPRGHWTHLHQANDIHVSATAGYGPIQNRPWSTGTWPRSRRFLRSLGHAPDVDDLRNLAGVEGDNQSLTRNGIELRRRSNQIVPPTARRAWMWKSATKTGSSCSWPQTRRLNCSKSAMRASGAHIQGLQVKLNRCNSPAEYDPTSGD